MVRPDITWSGNAYWHPMIQKNCREQLKIGTDSRATLASRATSAGARRQEKVTSDSLEMEGTCCVLSFVNLDCLSLGY